MYKKILVGILVCFLLAGLVMATYRREVYDYQGSWARQKVNYSLLSATNFSGERADFSGGWLNDGLSIINGSIYAQVGYFYNITSLNVTRQNLTITERLDILGDLTVDTNTLFVDSDNDRVGIGTASPDQTLHVHKGSAGAIASQADAILTLENDDSGHLQFLVPNNKNSQIFFGDDDSAVIGRIVYFHTDNSMRLYTNAAEKVAILANGRVGIGTSTPKGLLHVAGYPFVLGENTAASVKRSYVLSTQYDLGTEPEGYITIGGYSDTSTNRLFFGGGTAAYNAATSLGFYTAANTTTRTGTERMTILSGGNVGIGTSAPTHKLNVVGNVNVTGNLIAENVWIPKYIFAYTNNTIPVVSTGVWYNVTFDEKEYDVINGITHTYNDATNYSFYITEAGIYEVFGTLNIIDTSVNAEDHIMVYRIVKNGVEIHGSIWEGDFSRPDSASKRNFNILVECSVGDSLGLQFTGTDTDIKLFPRDSTGYGDEPAHSASIIIKRIA